MPTQLQNESNIAVEPNEQNVNPNWPHPEILQAKNGNIQLTNTTDNPIHLGKEVKNCKLIPTEDTTKPDENYYNFDAQLSIVSKEEIPNMLNTDNIKCNEARSIINMAHTQFGLVFNNDLSGGYNNYYGKHECGLNWATTERPSASKVHVPSYDHELKILQQEVMDDLTKQGVLLIPKDHDIEVQAICPSFLQRKQRARLKPKNQLNKNDVRLLINFGPINEKIKPVPNHVPKVNEVFIKLGRWKHIIYGPI